MVETLTNFAELMSLVDFDVYHGLPKPHDDTIRRLRELRQQGANGDTESLLHSTIPLGQDTLIRVFAVSVINPNNVSPTQLQQLAERLLHDENVSVQTAVAHKMQHIPLNDTIPILFQALIENNDPHLRAVIAHAIYKTKTSVTWHEKTLHLLSQLKKQGLSREHLDMTAFMTAVQPPRSELQHPQNRYLLTDYLIQQALNYAQDERMTGILAGLIIESNGRNLNRANQRLRQYEIDHHLPIAQCRLLRSEMNSLLTPAELEARLEETFQQPLRDANEQIHTMWRKSINTIHTGIVARQRASGLAFLSGFGLLLAALVFALQQDSSSTILAALFAIVSMITGAVYGGPVRDNKKVLADIGVANAAYAAYIQRTLAISNGFAHLYLQDKVTMKEVESTSNLISQAMKDTVEALRKERNASLDDLLNQLE